MFVGYSYSYVPKRNRAAVLISSQHHDKAVGTEEQQLKPEIILHYYHTKVAWMSWISCCESIAVVEQTGDGL